MWNNLESTIYKAIREKWFLKSEVGMWRFYLILLILLIPFFTLVLHTGLYHPMAVNAIFFVLSGLALFLSYQLDFVKRQIHNIVYVLFYAMAIYGVSNAYLSGFSLEFTFGYLATILFIGLALTNTKKLLWFAVPITITTSVLLYVSDTTHISKAYIIPLLVLFFTYVYFVLLSRNRIQDELYSSEKRFRTVVENMPVILWATDNKGKITLAEGKGLSFVGEKAQNAVGKSVFELYKELPELTGNIAKSLEGRSVNTITQFGEHYYEAWFTPIKNDKENVKGMIGIANDITERMKAEKTIIEQSVRNQKILQATLNGYLLLDKEGRIMDVNHAYCKMSGYSKEELLKMNVFDIDSVGDREIVDKAINKIIEKGSWKFETKHKRKNGELVHMEVSNTVIKMNGEPLIVSFLQDITDSKQYLDRLEESEEKYRQLFSKANDAIFIMDGEKFLECNEKALEMYGCDTKEQLIFKKPIDFSPEQQPDGESSWKKAERYLQKALQERTNFVFYWKHIKRDGTPFDAEVSLNAFELQGEVLIQAIVRDISERKKNERLLKESEERFRLLSEAAMEGIVLSENEVIVDANEQYAKMHGYDNKEEIVGMKLSDFISPSYMDVARHHIQTEYAKPYVLKARKKDGSEIIVEVRGQNVPYYGKTVRIAAISDITERINYENQLKESQERYKNHIESLPDGVLILENRKIVFANPSALKILGTNSGDIRKSSFKDFLLPEYEKKFSTLLKKIIDEKSANFSEIKIKRPKDGKIADIEATGRIVKFKGEESIQLVIHDISTRKQLAREQLRAQIAEETNLQLQREIIDRKKAENKLIHQQKYTRSIIDSSLDMIVATDIDHMITEFNTAAEKSFGYTKEEVMGMHISLLFADEEEQQEILSKITNEGSCAQEIVNKRRDGSLFISFLSASALKNEKGEVFGAMGVSRDITAIKKAEEELRLSEERHRAIYDQAYIGIARIGKVGRFLLVNQRLCDMLGYTSEELYRKAFFELTHPDEVESSLQNWDALLSGEIDNFSTEQIYIHKDGSEVIANLTVSMVKDADGNPNYYVAVFEDITERKKQEKKIQESLREKEVLLKEVHHRVKNNMQVISSILNLQSSYIKDDKTLEMLRESQNRIKSMSFIHESLYQSETLSHVNFTEYVKNLGTNLFHTYGVNQNGLDLKFDLDEVFLNLDTSIPCGLIINELMSNALKYAFKGKEKGNLKVSLKYEDEETLKLEITDDGIGFPEDIDFRETDSLGLQLVVTLVGQIDGEIELENKKGTKFTILFKDK